MKKIMLAVAALATLFATSAFAQSPEYARYGGRHFYERPAIGYHHFYGPGYDSFERFDHFGSPLILHRYYHDGMYDPTPSAESNYYANLGH